MAVGKAMLVREDSRMIAVTGILWWLIVVAVVLAIIYLIRRI